MSIRTPHPQPLKTKDLGLGVIEVDIQKMASILLEVKETEQQVWQIWRGI